MFQKISVRHTHVSRKQPAYRKDVTITPTKTQVLKSQPMLRKLCSMLTYCRPHGSDSERAFINRFLMPYKPTLVDGFGNLHFDRRTDAKNRTLFIGHCDSVHRESGRQTVYFDTSKQIIHTEGYCLGSDDASGLAMLMHLMDNNVPGYYIASRAEEIGGQGARFLVENHAELLSQFDRSVAFDRRADWSVITHQGGARCCSDEFAEALAGHLCTDGLMYAPDSEGVYTDTAEFVDLVPENTNLSIGYLDEHTSSERQDFAHFQHLAEAVLTVPWDSLPVERDPNVRDTRDAWGWGSYMPSLTSGAYADWPDLDDEFEAQRVIDIDWLLDSMGYMGLDAADLNDDELAAASAACEFIYDGRDTELRELLRVHAQCELQIPAAMDAETLKEWLEQCLIAGVSVATRALTNVIKGE